MRPGFFRKIAVAILAFSMAVPPAAVGQSGSPQFRVKLFNPNDAPVVPPDASTQSGTVTYATSYQAKVGVEFSVDPSVSGVEDGSSYGVASGALPSGLQVDPSNGRVSGYPDAAGQSGPVTVSAVGPTVTSTSNAFQIDVVEQTLSYPGATTASAGSTVAIAPTLSNAVAPRFFLHTGTLPDGLSVNLDSGLVEGVTTEVGTRSGLSVFAFGADGAVSISNPFSITVTAAAPVASASIAPNLTGQVGSAFSAAPTASGFSSSPTWTLAGTLPAGLSLNGATGAITGTPTTVGTTTGLVLTATAGAQTASTNAFQIAVSAAPPPQPSPTASIPSPIAGQVGSPLSATATHANFSSAPTWTLTGALPSGLSLNASTGAITGTPTVAGTTSGLILTATAGAQSAQTSAFQIVVSAAPVAATAAMATPISGQVGTPLSASPTSSGFSPAPTWTLTSGTLPAGLSVNASTGAVTGTPTVAEIRSGLVLTASNGAQTAQTNAFQIAVAAAPVAATAAMSTPINGVAGSPLSATPTSTGFSSAPTWSLSAGALPAGLSLNAATGEVSGSPVASGTTSGLVLTAVAGAQSAQTNAFSIVVSPIPAPATASMATPVNGTVGQALTATPTRSGFSAVPTWALTAGALPPGLSLNASTGAITGTPTVAGTTAGLVLTATAGAQSAQTNAFSIVVAAPPVTSTLAVSYPSTGMTRSVASVISPSTTGNVGAVTYAVTGALPPGVGFSTATGQFSGTPTTAGTYGNIRVTATDSQTSAQTPLFAIVVSAPTATGPGNQVSYAGSPFTSPAPSTTIGSPTWTVATGSLPAGLTLDPSSGVISGTPSPGAATATVSLRATEGGLTATTASFQISVVNVTVPSGATFAQGTSGSYTFTAPGLGGTVTWSVGGGSSLPPGLTLSPGGVLSGTPTGSGAQPPFTVVATSSNGQIVQSPPVSLNFTAFFVQNASTGFVVGQYKGEVYLSFRGSAPNPSPWRFSIVDGSTLPPGLYVTNVYVGGIGGTPWSFGTYPDIVVRATNIDTGMVLESDPVTVTVAPAPGAPLQIAPFEDNVVVMARGYGGGISASLAPGDPLFGQMGTKTLFIRPAAVADADGRVNGAFGIDRAPYTGDDAQSMNQGSRYETGSNANTFAMMSSRAIYTRLGTFENMRFVASDTSGGILESGRTGRAGFVGPFTLKVFEAWPAVWNNSSSVPTSTTPAANAGAVLTAGMSADMDFSQDIYGRRATINCFPGDVASFSVYSQLPDSTWVRMLTKMNQTCGASRFYEPVIDNSVGVGRKFRVGVISGQIRWSGGKIDSMGFTRQN